MKKIKPVKKSKQQLEREIFELKSQLAFAYSRASQELKQFTIDKLMGSGVVVQFSLLGKEANDPVCIRDGLSEDTILALLADYKRSYDLAVIHKP